MPSVFVSVATATVNPDTNILVSRPADVQEGDLLLLSLGIGNPFDDTLTVPTGWTFFGSVISGLGTARVFYAFKYAATNEPTQYEFIHSASCSMIAALAAYRGVQRDYAFNPILYPDGYFAPAGSSGVGVSGTSTTLTSATVGLPTTVIDYTRVVYAFLQYDSLAGTATFDDVSPLVPIRAKVQMASLSMMLVDAEYETPVTPTPTLTVTSSANKPWVVASLALEPYFADIESVDNYKSKLIRRMLPPPYDTRLSSNLGKLLAVIGTSDNEIGGLFGADDFLPDEA